MPRPDHSRDALVATTQTLLRRQGYAATGLAEIVRASGATNGSLYHHFPGGKEALAEAALDASADLVTGLLTSLLARDADVASVMRGWIEAMAAQLAADPRDGCPVAPAALEAVSASPILQAAAARAFDAWCAALADRLRRDGWPGDAAADAALVVVAQIEGALLLARTSGDARALRVAAAAADRLLQPPS